MKHGSMTKWPGASSKQRRATRSELAKLVLQVPTLVRVTRYRELTLPLSSKKREKCTTVGCGWSGDASRSNRESHDPAYDRGTDRGGRPSKPSTDSARSWWLRAPTAHADDYGEQLSQLAALLLQIGL